MSEPLVRYELRNRAAILTLQRVDKRNALSRSLISDIATSVDRALADAGARSIILTAAGSVFCAGMDLAELSESLASVQAGNEAVVWDDALRLATVYDRIYSSPKPTIAAVNGPAVAGGAGLVTVCDLALAVPSAKFGYPEVRRGLVAAMVMPHLLRHVGERMGRYLLLTGELIDAQEAKSAGLIQEVVAAEELLPRALHWAGLIAEGGPNAVAKTKHLLTQFSRQAISIEEATKASAAPRLTAECQEGLQAFFNKLPPPWAKS